MNPVSWWLALPRTAKIAGSIGVISAAIVSTGAAWSALDLPVLATRWYVDHQVEPLGTTRIQLLELKRELLEAELFRLEQEQTKVKSEATHFRIVRIRREIDGINKAIDRINQGRSGPEPAK